MVNKFLSRLLHLAEVETVKTSARIKLKYTLKTVPTVVPDTQKVINLPPAAIFRTLKNLRKPQEKRVLKENELDDFKKKDCISNLEGVISKAPANVDKEHIFHHKNECNSIFKL